MTLLSVVCILVLPHWPRHCRHRCWARTTVLRPSDSLHWCIQKLGREDPWIYWSPQRRSDFTYRISLFGAVCSQTFHQVITAILRSLQSTPSFKEVWNCCVCKWVIREKSAPEGNVKYDQALKHDKQWVEHWTGSQDSWVLHSVLIRTCCETLSRSLALLEVQFPSLWNEQFGFGDPWGSLYSSSFLWF